MHQRPAELAQRLERDMQQSLCVLDAYEITSLDTTSVYCPTTIGLSATSVGDPRSS
jgi:hypothetical protein